jgi:hypothetical protein
MVRSAALACLLVLSASLAPAAENKALPLAAKLKETVKFDGFDDPKTTLGEALDKLADQYALQFDVNELAFKEDQVEDVRGAEVVIRPIPKMTNVRLETVLHKVLARVPCASGATYLVRRNVIEVTTQTTVLHEIWGENYLGPYLPLVNQGFDKRPLEDALKDLADAADFNIVLDSRAAEKAKTAVSANFENTPLDTAVRLLADMADLKPFRVDNVLYVTTRERANQMEAKEKQKLNEDSNTPPQGSRAGRGRWFPRPSGPGA